MAECEGEKVVTMMDVLQEQEEFEEDANAVLGASDDKNCTYSKGYIKRQAVYACLTCCSDAKIDPTKRAGVCLACSLNCHENHELIELYTRRNFRCDCGNPKFNFHPCQFTPNKTNLNEDNKYNQNFIGIYCTCHRPYPDPDAMFEDEMIQCTICEDWLHASHLEATLPGNDQYSEMICKACMEINEFLHDYSYLAVNIDVEDADITLNETVECNVNEKLPNGSFGLSPTNQEIGKEENIKISTETNDKNEAIKNKITSSTTIEKELNALINGTVIASNGNNENEKMLQIENVSNSKEVHLETDNTAITKNTDQIEEAILNTNKVAALKDTLNGSDKSNMSMETDESQESQQRHRDNVQNVCISTCTTISDVAPVATNIENESEQSNSEESNVAGSDRILEVLSSKENKVPLKDEKIAENTVIARVENNLDFEKSDWESTDENFRKVEEIEPLIVPKTDQKDPVQSSNIYSEKDTALNDLDGNETGVEIKDPSTEEIVEGDKRNLSQPTDIVNKVDTTLKNVETNQSENRTEDQPMEEIEGGTEKIPLQSTEIGGEVDTELKNIEDNKFDGNTEEHSIETIDKETEKLDIPVFTEVPINVDITQKNADNSESGTKTEEQNFKSIDKETDEIDISESSEVNTDMDITLDHLKDSESGTKSEDQCTESIDKETSKMDISESTEVNTNIDITLDNLKDSELCTKTQDQFTESIDKETDKMDISEFTEDNTNIDITKDNLKDRELGIIIEDQSTESTGKETGKKDISDSTKVDTNIDIILNNVEDSESETKTDGQSTEKLHKDGEKKHISESTEVDSYIDTMLDDLKNSESENKTAGQSTELIDKEADKKDMFESIKVDSNIDTIFNHSDGNNSKSNTEKEDTGKIDEKITNEESVDQSDTLEKATRELLELTSDMVEELEEDLLLESNVTAATNKEFNSNEVSSETHNKGDTDIGINNIKTAEYVDINDISRDENPSSNNVQIENGHKRKYYDENEEAEVKKAKIEEKNCLRQKGVQRIFRGATFWPSDFRQKLCTCNECLTMYKDLRLMFLLDPEDTVTAYETLGKQKIEGTPTTQYEKGLQALSSLDRVQQINALTEYNIMRDKLLDFLKSFKERKEVVKEEDIRAFFAGMKPRREPDGVYFCR